MLTLPVPTVEVAINSFYASLNPRPAMVLPDVDSVATKPMFDVLISVRKPTPPTQRTPAAVSATEVGCPPAAIVVVGVSVVRLTWVTVLSA
jgi:hypothetical protein